MGKIPDLLQGEIARLNRRFRVKLDPMRHTGQKDLHLVCKLGNVTVLMLTFPQKGMFTFKNQRWVSDVFL